MSEEQMHKIMDKFSYLASKGPIVKIILGQHILAYDYITLKH